MAAIAALKTDKVGLCTSKIPNPVFSATATPIAIAERKGLPSAVRLAERVCVAESVTDESEYTRTSVVSICRSSARKERKIKPTAVPANRYSPTAATADSASVSPRDLKIRFFAPTLSAATAGTVAAASP